MTKNRIIFSLFLMVAIFLSSCSNGSSNESTNSIESTNSGEVSIGKQVWMTKNLNVDKFRNGDPIPEAKTEEEWERAGDNKQPAWCYYNNDPKNGNKYGRLYNWYAINDARGIAPVGWHIPSDQEWSILEKSIGNESGKKFKGKSAWVFEGENGKIVLELN